MLVIKSKILKNFGFGLSSNSHNSEKEDRDLIFDADDSESSSSSQVWYFNTLHSPPFGGNESTWPSTFAR